MFRKTHGMLAGALMCGLATTATAAEADVQTELAQLKAEIAQLKGAQNESWLTQRRAEEVKGLIREVLADADTRASLMQEGITAGHDGKSFFLASPDGAFKMNIAGQLQFRYIFNSEGDAGLADDESGFQYRRMKLKFKGHVADPKLGYNIVLAGSRGGGNVGIEDAVMSYDLSDNVELDWGTFKLPFLRQELTSSSRQIAVDRAPVTEHFTLNRSEQVQVSFIGETIRGAVSFNDGANNNFTDFAGDGVDFGLTARVDAKLAGDWGAMKDVSSWDAEQVDAFVGGGLHYQSANDNSGMEDYFAYTVDGSVEIGHLGLFAAFMGAEADAAAHREVDDYGILLEAGYFVVPDKLEPFVRYEYLDVEDGGAGGEGDANIVTAGLNYYIDGHAAKFTLDGVFVMDDLPAENPFGSSHDSSGLGLLDGLEDEVAVRAQFQLLF